jgi:hypothetical protein
LPGNEAGNTPIVVERPANIELLAGQVLADGHFLHTGAIPQEGRGVVDAARVLQVLATTFAGFACAASLCSVAMFDPIREQIETAAGKTAQLRRFL